MFAKSIVLSDAFLDMPLSARCLYFTLGMLADDDGFVGNPKSIMRQCGASQDDMLNLLQKRYILSFDSGVIVIKHWRMNNYLQNDRHKKTTYLDEMQTLTIDNKGAYTEINKGNSEMYTECIQNGYEVDTQYRLGKVSIDKDSIGEVIEDAKASKLTRHKYGEYKHVLLTDEERDKLLNEFGDKLFTEYVRKVDEYCQQYGKSYKDYNLTIRNWIRKDGSRTTQKPGRLDWIDKIDWSDVSED